MYFFKAKETSFPVVLAYSIQCVIWLKQDAGVGHGLHGEGLFKVSETILQKSVFLYEVLQGGCFKIDDRLL